MTVAELLDHFHIYPDAIEFYDITENVEDTIYLKLYVDTYDVDAYDDFLSEYGDRIVKEWKWQIDYSLYIQFAKEEDE